MSVDRSILFPTKQTVVDRKYYEAGVRGRFEKNLRMVRGSINTTTPTITAGVGFTVVRNGTGDVTITFDPPFSAQMSIKAIAIHDVDATPMMTYIRTRSSVTARILRHLPTVGNQDGEFDFIATGPS
jgi:hypothetical protein